MPIAIPFDEDGKQVLVPTVAPDGSALSDEAAVEQYKTTGRHYGKFDTPANAQAYADQLTKTATPPAATAPETPPAAPAPGMPVLPGTRRVGATVTPTTPAEPAPPVPGPGPGPGPPPLPSLEQHLAGVSRINPLTGQPATATQVEGALALARANHAKLMAETEESRARLKSTLANGAASLADGRPFNWNEAEIRSLIPQPDADKIVGVMRDSEKAGQFIGSIRVSTPEANEQHRAELLAGLSDPQAPDYEHRKKLLNIYETKLQEQQKERDDDAAMYAYKYFPGVGEKLQAAFTEQNRPSPPGAAAINPKIAETWDDYVQSTKAAQRYLGVPEDKQRILPSKMGQQEVQRIAALDLTKTNPVEYMATLAAKYGAGQGAYDHWPQVFGELVKHHKLPGEYQVLASMDQPNQAVAADDLGRALKLIAEKGGKAELKQAQGSMLPKAVDDDLREKLADLRHSTILNGPGGIKLYDTVEDAVRSLTYYYRYANKSDTRAVDDAIAGIIGNKYDFPEIGGTTVRVPKDTGSVVATAAERIQADITPGQLGPIRGQPLLSPAQRQETWMSSIRNGGWAMNEDDTGIVLMARLRQGSYIPVERSDGSHVVLKFRDAPAYAHSEPQTPPATALPPRDTVAAPPIVGGPRLPGIVRSPAPAGTVMPQPGLR
jgi:hypothetical protein